MSGKRRKKLAPPRGPTPGPYVLRDNPGGYEVRGRLGVLIAHFGLNLAARADGTHCISDAEARQNAQTLLRALRGRR